MKEEKNGKNGVNWRKIEQSGRKIDPDLEKSGKVVVGEDGKLKLTGVFGADTPADWGDDPMDDFFEREDSKSEYDKKVQAEYDRIANLMKAMPYNGEGGVGIAQTGYQNGIGTDLIVGGDVYTAKKTDINDIIEIAAHYGKWGSAISDLEGRLFATAGQICKAWGVYGWQKVQDLEKPAKNFLFDLRNWFLEKYMPMLNACATPSMYAEFKGMNVKSLMSRINYQTRKKIRDNDDMQPPMVGYGYVRSRNTRKRMEPMDFVTIAGVRFILVPLDEIEAWYVFLAKKGIGVLVTEARFGEARYLGNMLVEQGEMTQAEVDAVLSDSDTVEMWVRSAGMMTKGDERAVGDTRKWGGDNRRQWYSDEAWEEYERFCKKKGFTPVSYARFGRRIKALGFTRFAKGGRRGFYWWEADAE